MDGMGNGIGDGSDDCADADDCDDGADGRCLRSLKGPHVTGVLVSDKNGLTLAAKGTLKAHVSGHWLSVYEQAIAQAPGQPTISVETPAGYAAAR
jgi:hypothetical protein